MDEKDEQVIYLIVRNDLKMGKGKIVAQCGHAVQYAVRACNENLLKEYEMCDTPKICLKVDTFEQFKSLRNRLEQSKIAVFTVVDAGYTQVEPNTETCFAVGPASKLLMKDFIKELKLL